MTQSKRCDDSLKFVNEALFLPRIIHLGFGRGDQVCDVAMCSTRQPRSRPSHSNTREMHVEPRFGPSLYQISFIHNLCRGGDLARPRRSCSTPYTGTER